ncbi:MAG: 2,4-dihydroxyhept-2-ene-1,7-dioic acid aldolase [Lentisphaeria bacterium]|nr:2,4-dihydroxyhept-2-ene-1,7-dioic acid aldolase [Lentisphaeria bacterium]
MMSSSLRRALLERRVSLGTWIQIGHPAVAEVLAGVGFDWLCVDCEHTDIGPAGFAALARGMHGRGPVPLARVRENDTLAIRQVLDLGAMGVIVPLVNSAAEAARAVRAAKYPPQGVRGFAFHRGNDWGAGFDAYAERANGEIAVVVMVESRQAVEDIDAILAVEGIDGVFIGPYDLSGSYGIPGQTSHASVRQACARVAEACRQAGKSAGVHVVLPTPDGIRAAIEEGFTFVAVGVDTVFLERAGRTAVAAARDAAAPGGRQRESTP